MSAPDQQQIMKKITSRCYWETRIIPDIPFKEDYLIDRQTMKGVLQSASVDLRGWDYPHIPPYDNEGHSIYPKVDGWESVAEFGWHKEVWRFWQSGLFVHLFSEFADWLDEDPWGHTHGAEEGEKYLDPLMTLYRATEILLFARNLSGLLPGQPTLKVSVKIIRLKGRRLKTILSPTRHWFGEYICKGEDDFALFDSEVISGDAPEEEIFRKARIGLVALYQLFSWNTSSEQAMLDDQQRLVTRRLH